MPHVFAQLPFPKASLAVLEVFTTIAGIEIDLAELSEQAKDMEQQLGELLARVEQASSQSPTPSEEEAIERRSPAGGRAARARRTGSRSSSSSRRPAKDRSHAYELKRELDRLGVFKEYEDRFLDLFKKAG